MKITADDKRLKELNNLEEYMKFLLTPEEFDYTKFKIEWLQMLDGIDVFYERFAKIPAIKDALKKYLQLNYDHQLAESFVKHFS